MGIKGLFPLLEEKAPHCFRRIDIKVFTGKVIACDASNVMYQFLVTTSGSNTNADSSFELTDKDGNPTGHLVGLFNRSISFMENKIKPIWVFDGKPPELKMEELKRRKELKLEAQENIAEAKEVGNVEDMQKFKKRNIKITSQMLADAKKMLTLMGLPIVESESEAEAQCVDLVKKGKAYAVASEDMDCLTFGAPIQLRGFNVKKEPIIELELDSVLKELEMNMDEFVDFCILCGSDYTKSIDGLGPSTAYKMIKEFKNIEGVLEEIKDINNQRAKDNKPPKYELPDVSRYNYKAARNEFKGARVVDSTNLVIEFGDPNEAELREFLCTEKQFGEMRVNAGLEKLKESKVKKVQSTLESFFGKPTKVINNLKGAKDKDKGKLAGSSKRK